ncbi:probable L-type lectin-domain containing receptor kinase S.5 [Phragmites australis]|uniref:probable L-type lectin-domain containing receptor kinase S.5 n=1 Tax=Phragmites australis TaxID=29695 RepID=UPI002D771ED4|nr:probable L-type lectin-domain containing receptor kinase S.5 [Phragmites australis]
MTGPSRRGHGATTSLALLLLLWTVAVCSLPAVRAQATTFTTTVAGREFTNFAFPKFDNILLQLPTNLTFWSNASVSQNALQITPDSSNNASSFLVNQTGRVFFATPFVLWTANASNSTADGRYVASFSTVFKVNLYRANPAFKGEGLAFLVASGNDGPPSGSDGGYLGLTNASTDGLATNGFAAVELDTVKQSYDPDDNHVGLDFNGVRSTIAKPLAPFGIQLAPNDTSTSDGSHMVWVDYNGTSRHVWVYMSSSDDRKPATAVLNASLDLSAILLGKKAYFGFSASTGVEYQLNCVLMWNMTVEKLLDGTTGDKALSGWKLGVTIGVPCGVAALALGLLAGLYIRKKKKKVGDDPSSVFNNAIDLRSIPGVPKEFDYKELKKGTNNFDERMKLGQGGYGVVYRATVPGENARSMEVAVKQFSGANTKGQEDFLAELSIINRLRHRNLVKLVGWCHQNGVLLLVYDYMPNGSLDRHLFGGKDAPTLDWKQRYNVVTGVASALNYLHHEFDQTVIHRDIKPSNIMLDSAFNARLGDFGLARALESDKTSYTDKIGVPGTLGYIAPECFHTGRATRESDVFGFGAVILEIVCGRRISCSNPAGCSQLLEWVWRLHGAGRVLETVDTRLAGEYDEEDAERLLLLGLACSHPNPGERPRAQAIMQNLTRSVPPLAVPMSKPVFMWPVPRADGEEYGETPTSHSGVTSTAVTSSSYYASSGWTQNYQVSREDHEYAAEKDVPTV